MGREEDGGEYCTGGSGVGPCPSAIQRGGGDVRRELLPRDSEICEPSDLAGGAAADSSPAAHSAGSRSAAPVATRPALRSAAEIYRVRGPRARALPQPASGLLASSRPSCAHGAGFARGVS